MRRRCMRATWWSTGGADAVAPLLHPTADLSMRITSHVRSFILISLSCVLGTAAGQDIGSGQTRDLVLDSTSEITFDGPVRCKMLRIVGKPVVRSKSEVRESRDASTSGV